MNDKVEKEFVDGLIIKAPNDKAPEFVKCGISIKRSALISWLTQKTDDWINIDVKVSQKGKWYAEVNSWQPSRQDAAANHQPNSNQGQQQSPPDDDFDIPY